MLKSGDRVIVRDCKNSATEGIEFVNGMNSFIGKKYIICKKAPYAGFFILKEDKTEANSGRGYYFHWSWLSKVGEWEKRIERMLNA